MKYPLHDEKRKKNIQKLFRKLIIRYYKRSYNRTLQDPLLVDSDFRDENLIFLYKPKFLYISPRKKLSKTPGRPKLSTLGLSSILNIHQ